jgi:hypothetical protein
MANRARPVSEQNSETSFFCEFLPKRVIGIGQMKKDGVLLRRIVKSKSISRSFYSLSQKRNPKIQFFGAITSGVL